MRILPVAARRGHKLRI